MDLWYTDNHTDNVRFSMKVEKQLFSEKSYFQQIEILKTKDYGKVLVLDGELFTTERDEFVYHEMVVHVPMAVHPDIKTVLVIGGGDGGTVRELTKYDTIETIDVAELDSKLVEHEHAADAEKILLFDAVLPIASVEFVSDLAVEL